MKQTYKLTAPTGARILGTAEIVPGFAKILNPQPINIKGDTGSFTFEHEGETVLHWNGQETRTLEGQRLWLDDTGELWLERELKLIEEEGS